ncbi:murein L,D-transpeptidase [Massilia varians]|uniref:Murein L,D-transpeptidase n=1 Tax=Massilia varians TaxID=457921 RepID=A0ABM8C8Q0_9BURK|nr:L,D-transpeptidase family protein [Massilia varians]BDT59602.1 murein L,D-transpeptidase [Massilia varians]
MTLPFPALLRSSAHRTASVLLLYLVLAASPQRAPAFAAPVDAGALAARLYASGAPPRWLEHGQAPARLALRLLGDAATHGLDPALYRTDELAHQLDRAVSPDDKAAFERALSTAMLQYLADLHAGRTPSPYRQDQDALAGFDPVAELRQAAASGRLADAVDAAAPALPLYARVKASLAQYRELAGRAPEWPALPAGAAALRERLRLLGDLEGGVEEGDAGAAGSPALASAVRRFQERHGLVEDGRVGPATLAALAVPPAQRAAQLALTLERLRWLPPLRGRVIAVNVPAYRLWAFDLGQAASTPLEMRVIVGRAAGTPTPSFLGHMRAVEFNPYWNVPRSIALGEILPKLVHHPAYLRQNDMELVAANGQVLATAGPQAVAALRTGTARVRQRPGAKNALGNIKFAMPNPMNIYLHSTPSQELFQRGRRDLSHGCIRVEHPAALASFVLADPDRWSEQQIAAAMRPGPPRTVSLATPVTVILFYATAVTDRQGRVLFANDIYGRDRQLSAALASR